ncbi:MAG: hypothetical protein R8G66_30415 [Cytophagales bacterium]|nr:hypothetical protein [Cytophagales bacterium]
MRTDLIALLLTVVACGPTLKDLPLSSRFSEKEIIGQSNDARLQEASGLAVSFKNPGHLWTHNDSGGKPELYLINEKGDVAMTARLKGAKNRDWEDIAISRDGSGYVFIGEIGDNNAVHESLTIYRIVEPAIDSTNKKKVNYDQMTIQYEEGARDAETLMVDPFTKNLILLTKREDNILVYSFAFEAGTSKVIASKGTMPLTWLTAGDINAKGDILIKNYNQVFYLENKNKTPIVELLLNGKPELIDYEVEKQGEALTWSLEGNSFFLLSEWNDDQPQPLYRYY